MSCSGVPRTCFKGVARGSPGPASNGLLGGAQDARGSPGPASNGSLGGALYMSHFKWAARENPTGPQSTRPASPLNCFIIIG